MATTVTVWLTGSNRRWAIRRPHGRGPMSAARGEGTSRPGGFLVVEVELRPDVLVVAEEVARVVPALDVDQAVGVAFVVVLDPLLIVAGHEVDVAPRL